MHDRANVDEHSLIKVGNRAVRDTFGNNFAVANNNVIKLAF